MRRANKRRLWGICLTVLAAAANGQQSIYHWTDENGQVHYGDRPPGDVSEYETVGRTRALAQPDESDEEQVIVPVVSEPAKVEEESNAPSTRAAQAAGPKNSERCQRARDNLWQIENSARVRAIEADGEYRFLSPEEKETARLDSIRQIETYCD